MNNIKYRLVATSVGKGSGIQKGVLVMSHFSKDMVLWFLSVVEQNQSEIAKRQGKH